MTIAISIKIYDAVVLATDSATTFSRPGPNGALEVHKVYNHADKLVNLSKGLPVGMMTWGQAGIGPASIATLSKDLRRRLSGEDKAHGDWTLSQDAYTVEEIATRVREFMYEELYKPAFRSSKEKPSLGFCVAGFSAGEQMAEEWVVQVEAPTGDCSPPEQVRARLETGWVAWGQPGPVVRLLLGLDPQRTTSFLKSKLPRGTDVQAALDELRALTEVNPVNPAMPLQDAIDLAVYLVEVVRGFVRFNDGAATVGGPIDVAAITRHEGFKWIRRKHYYSAELNPQPNGG